MKLKKFTAYLLAYLLVAIPVLFAAIYVFVSNSDTDHKIHRALAEVSYRFNRAQDIAAQIEKDPRAALEKNEGKYNHEWNPGHSYIKRIFTDLMTMHPYVRGIERQDLSGEAVVQIGENIPKAAGIRRALNKGASYGPIFLEDQLRYISTSPVLNDNSKVTAVDIVVYEPNWLEGLSSRLGQAYRAASINLFALTKDGLYSPKQKKLGLASPNIQIDRSRTSPYVMSTETNEALGVLPKYKVAFHLSNTNLSLVQKLAGLSRNIKLMILGMFGIICSLPFVFFLPKIPIWSNRKLERELVKERYAADSAQHTLNEKLFGVRSALSEIVGISDALKNTALSPEQESLVNRFNVVVSELRDNDPGSLRPRNKEHELKEVDQFMTSEELNRLLGSLELKAARNESYIKTEIEIGSGVLAGPVETFKKSLYHVSVRMLSILKPGSTLTIAIKETKMDEHSTTLIVSLVAAEIKKGIHWPLWCRQLSILSRGSELSESLINCRPILSDEHGLKIAGTFKTSKSVKEFKSSIESVSEPDQTKYDSRTPTILVVDDNTMNRKVLSALLEKRGCEVVHAENGAEALSVLSQPNEVELVFMDLEMPIMNGLDATKAIREQGEVFNPEVPVVALTAHAKDAYESGCISSGMNDYLTKPILPSDVKDIIKKWCKIDLDSFKKKKSSLL